MQDYLAPIKLPLNLWNKYSIRPGPVGTVGDVLGQVRFKQSAPDLAPRYDIMSSGQMEKYYGSNVQDGRVESFASKGYNAKVNRRGLAFRGQKTAFGWIKQDIMEVDRTREPIQQEMPQFGWKSQVAKVERAKVTGEQFLPLPNGYGPTEPTRGSNYPRVVEKSAGVGVSDEPAPVAIDEAAQPVFSYQRPAGERVLVNRARNIRDRGQ